MSVNVKPIEQLEFRGVYTAGSPAQRPRNTAQVCEDFRVMPGNYLRLRSGRVKRGADSPGTVLQVGTCRVPDYWGECYGADSHIVQVVIGGVPQWAWMLVNVAGTGRPGPSYTIITPANTVEAITTTYDSGFGVAHPVAFCNLSNRPVFYNGKGVRDGGHSSPPFSTFPRFDAEVQQSARYFGLDAYCAARVMPVTAFVAGTGYNKWQTSLKVYVGLWHKPSDHYSNGVLSYTFLDPQAATGSITVTQLSNLTYATHGADETAELYYVFYATIDGGQVPYLILNATLDGPYAVPVTVAGATTNLSIDSLADCGFNLDLTHEMPTENHPPRPMRSISFVNGRMYGVLMNGGSVDPAFGQYSPWPFTYVPLARDLPAVVWSAAAGDSLGSDFLGDPLQSWPFENIAYTPTGEQPVITAPSPDGQSVLVITATASFFLQEMADGMHTWVTISRVHGISNPKTLAITRHGLMWVTQRNQIVLLTSDSLAVMSDGYQTLLTGKPRCADYILDPIALVDRYQVWMDTGKAVCHDFTLTEPGVGYTASNQDFTTAMTTVDKSGLIHHIVAKDAFYTHEVQPDGGIPVTDAGTEINGTYVRNWDDFGDSDVRKELPMVDVMGDGDVAGSLAVSPLSLEWYGDFEQVIEANKKTVTGARITQSTTDPSYRLKLTAANKFWYKLVFKLRGHSTENGGAASKYPDPATEGDGLHNFYGMILRALWRLGIGENRA